MIAYFLLFLIIQKDSAREKLLLKDVFFDHFVKIRKSGVKASEKVKAISTVVFRATNMATVAVGS